MSSRTAGRRPRRYQPRHDRDSQGWEVSQPGPGHFQITTPAGRTYDIHPDIYPA